MKVLFPYKQRTYNEQVLDILDLYNRGQIVFCRGDDLVENSFCIEQALSCKYGEHWNQIYSKTAIESAARMLMSLDGSLEPYPEQLATSRA